MKTIKVTLDTNVLDPANLAKILQVAHGLPIAFANVTVSVRELEGSSISPLPKPVLETAVWDESRWDQAVWGGESDSDLFERLLAIVSNGSFPRLSQRNSLTPGQRRQLRDVMILVAHIRERRDILVTNEKKAFVGKGGVLKEKLETMYSTRIMNADEFCSFCVSFREEAEELDRGISYE